VIRGPPAKTSHSRRRGVFLLVIEVGKEVEVGLPQQRVGYRQIQAFPHQLANGAVKVLPYYHLGVGDVERFAIGFSLRSRGCIPWPDHPQR
jgi:hypothetical protein